MALLGVEPNGRRTGDASSSSAGKGSAVGWTSCSTNSSATWKRTRELTGQHPQLHHTSSPLAMDPTRPSPALPLELIILILREAMLGLLAEGHQGTAASLCFVAQIPLVTLRKTLYYQPIVRYDGLSSTLYQTLDLDPDWIQFVQGVHVVADDTSSTDPISDLRELVKDCTSLSRIVVEGNVQNLSYLPIFDERSFPPTRVYSTLYPGCKHV